MGEWCVVRSLRAAIVFGLVAAGLIGAGAARASAAQCESWGGLPPNVGSGDNQLHGVAATSSCNAWAVGFDFNGTVDQTLIERWNGKVWKVQPSKNRGVSDNELFEVAATSPTNAWAVGYYRNGKNVDQTLIEHWNGKVWKVQASLNPGGSTNNNDLSGVAATSPTNAWAVGHYYDGTSYRTLIEHWNGTAWSVQSSPSLAGFRHSARPALMVAPTVALTSVTATSPSNAWAVGFRYNGTANQTLVEHWNGKAWKVQASPNPGGSGKNNALRGVAATSATNAWAVGDYFKGHMPIEQTLIERWNGKAWRVQPSANDGSSTDPNALSGVAATSSNNAWAVGDYGAAFRADPPLVERWNGNAWKIQPSANLDNSFIYGVAATSSQDAWAVGFYDNGTVQQTLALHCC